MENMKKKQWTPQRLQKCEQRYEESVQWHKKAIQRHENIKKSFLQAMQGVQQVQRQNEALRLLLHQKEHKEIEQRYEELVQWHKEAMQRHEDFKKRFLQQVQRQKRGPTDAGIDEQQLMQQRVQEYKQRHRELEQLHKEFMQQREEFKQRFLPAMHHARQVKGEKQVLRLLLQQKQQEEIEQRMKVKERQKNERQKKRPSFQALKDFIGSIRITKSYKRLEKLQMD